VATATSEYDCNQGLFPLLRRTRYGPPDELEQKQARFARASFAKSVLIARGMRVWVGRLPILNC
jgi:hypothetical protein